VNENWNDESYLRKAIKAIENGAKINYCNSCVWNSNNLL
jgi:hypothetical protein